MATAMLRQRARRLLEKPASITPEAWAKNVEEARKRGCHLVRVGSLTIEIRDYSLEVEDG